MNYWIILSLTYKHGVPDSDSAKDEQILLVNINAVCSAACSNSIYSFFQSSSEFLCSQ